jgi:filamentous hemagglutinin family protein
MSVKRFWKGGVWRKGLQWATGALGLLPLGLAVFSVPVFAQIVPDNTLGSESSLVTPNVNIRGLPAERIDGGAVRGSALFHSFSEFNVNNGQRVYFSNPAGIADIFSRVTGSNISNILGTLGVDGGANLFVLNPNGILFGPNAQLDIQGSFLATTGSSFKFSDGSDFSATNPQAAPLLSINVTPGVQWGANQPGATITNRGNLSAGEDLTLEAGNLDLQGQLQAGRDLTLQAQDTLTVRDIDTSRSDGGNGGNITLSAAKGNITVTGNLNSSSSSSFGNSGNGGAIALTAGGNITTNDLFSASESTSFSRSVSYSYSVSGNGGAISLTAGGDITTKGNINSDSVSYSKSNSVSDSVSGNGGAISLTAGGNITTNGLDS